LLRKRIVNKNNALSSKNKLIRCLLLCVSGPGDITFGRSSLRLTELSQSKSGCGNRYAWFTLHCVHKTVAVHERLREPLRQSKAARVRGWYNTR
jgi:hypothetical protein